MDLYKISYDVRRPEMDALTITKDSKFAIQFQFVKDEKINNYVDSDPEKDRPFLRLKKADGTTITLFTAKHGDEIVDSDGIYLWTMEEKFDSDVSCYIDIYQYYYDEETEEEWENEIKDCCICQIKCKDSSIAYNAISPTPYTEATSIRAGLNSKDSGYDSIAIGADANAGDSSVAIGTHAAGATVSKFASIAIGKDCKAENSYVVAIGNGVKAKSKGAITIGDYQTKIDDDVSEYALAIGSATKNIDSKESVAIGHFATNDTADYSIAIGCGSENKSAYNSIAIGHDARVKTPFADKIQLGTGTLSASNTLMQVKNFPLLDTSGKIMQDRFPSDIGSADNPLDGLFFRDQQNNGKIWYLWIVDGEVEVNIYE